MTATVDHRPAPPGTPPASPPAGAVIAGRRSLLAPWLLAARLARREVRRRRGRTALVVVLIALPIAAMTIGSVAYRTTRDSGPAAYARSFGRADLGTYASPVVPAEGSGGSVRPAETAEPRPLDPADLPAGSRVVTVHEATGRITTTSGAWALATLTDLPLADPITSGMARIRQGRAPVAAGEAAISAPLARTLGVGIGDTLHLAVPAAGYLIVGIVRHADFEQRRLLVLGGFDFTTVRNGAALVRQLVDLPPGVQASSLSLPSELAVPGSDAWFGGMRTRGDQLAWGWVAGALALTVMGIVIAAAFASSARRQLVTLGQLSANGAGRPLLRRTLALQGAWSGVAGAVLGVVVGLALVLPAHGLLERIANHELGPTVVAAGDVAVILVTGVAAATVAAFAPSRTASRVPVLTALAGRIPLGQVPRLVVPAGVVLGAGGVGLVLLGVAISTGDGGHPNISAGIVVVGGLALLAGICCLSPAIVAVFGRIAERVGGADRLAARSLARTRTRSAAVVAAIAATGALAVAAGTAIAASRRDDAGTEVPYLRQDMVLATTYLSGVGGDVPADGTGDATIDLPAPTYLPVSADVRDQLLEIVPGATVVPIRSAGWDPAPTAADGAAAGTAAAGTGAGVQPWYGGADFVVADPALLDAVGLSARDRQALEEVGMLDCFLPAAGQPATPTTYAFAAQAGTVTFRSAHRQDLPAMWALVSCGTVTPAAAARLGMTVGESGVLLIAPDDLTAAQQQRLSDLSARLGWVDSTFLPPSAALPEWGLSVSWGTESGRTPWTLIETLIAAAALLLTLGVVAAGLALSAAETRDERDVLVAVGASPRTIRATSARKAVLLALVGGVLAVPAGFLPVAVAVAQTTDGAVAFPWRVALGCAVAIPLLVGLAAYGASALAQRLRPVRMSTLTPD